MATVYLADDLRHQRKVALKVLKPELAAVVGAERVYQVYVQTEDDPWGAVSYAACSLPPTRAHRMLPP